MTCRLHALTLMVLVVGVLSGWGQGTEKREKPIRAWERRDVLGRPIPWGKEVGGQRVSLWLPYTRMLYGQPIHVRLETAQATDQPPYLRLHWNMPGQTIFLECTSEAGETVCFLRHGHGGSSYIGGNAEEFRLQPTGKFARGQYLAPGKYRLRAIIDAKRSPADPNGWAGRVESNVIDFVVFESDERGRAQLVPEPTRVKAAALALALDDSLWKVREQAEKELLAIGIDAVPALEKALGSSTVEVRMRARRIFTKLTEPLLQARRFSFEEPTAEASLMAHFGEPAWKFLAESLPPEHIRFWRVEATRMGPVPWIPPTDPLPVDVAKRLVADLRSEEPHIRLAASRAVPRTTNQEVLTALVERLADPYSAIRRASPCMPVPERVVADEARFYAIPRQGKAAIDPLLKLAYADSSLRQQVVELLGQLGPDPRSLAFLRDPTVKRDPRERLDALKALAKLGSTTVADLQRIAEAEKEDPIVRRMAIEELAHQADAKEAGPFLLKMLRHPHWEFACAAVQVVDKIRLREALPELKRLAQDDKVAQNVQSWAICSYARLADRNDAAELLLERLGSKSSSARGQAAFMLSAIEWRQAVPRLLELLSDPDWYVRAQADTALRGLARRPQGVGYRAENPEPGLWRNWWKEQR